MEQTSTSTKLTKLEQRSVLKTVFTGSRSDENTELVLYSNEYIADQNTKSALCHPILVCPHMWPSFWHTILWYSLETKLKITFFFPVDFSDSGRKHLFFSWGQHNIKPTCLLESNGSTYVLTEKDEKKKKRRVERIILYGMWHTNERSWNQIGSLPSAPVKLLYN